ncbi:MAG: histidine phosphatase family protein [Myxococcota bacterium]
MSAAWWRESAVPAGVTHRLIVVRHGEPVATARGRCYGKLDVDLSERGRHQARLAGARLRAAGLHRIYTSPRLRASATAALIASAVATSAGEPVVDERFAELDFGAIEGMTYERVAAEYPELYARWMATPTEVHFPDGECFADMAARVGAGSRELRQRHPGQAVAVVAHGGVARILLAEALRIAAADIFRIGYDYAGLSCIDWYDEIPLVRQVNWTPPESAGEPGDAPR